MCGDQTEWTLAISNGGGIIHAAITGFMIKQREAMSNKVNTLHLIFDSNSTTYVETYIIPTKFLKLAPRSNLNPSLPT